MCRKCNAEAFEASTDDDQAVEGTTTGRTSPPTDEADGKREAAPEETLPFQDERDATGDVPDDASDGPESATGGLGDASRRRFLKAATAAAGSGALIGASGTAAAAYECGVADRWDKSPNQSDWRSDSEINWIVLHITDCTYGTAIDTFNDPDSNVSAHYVVSNYDWSWGAPGEVTQMVEHNYKAWHAGPGNYHSIGIEHEMGYSDASWNDAGVNRYINDACYDSAADIIACCVEKYDIPLDFYPQDTGVCMQNNDGGIIGHRDVTNQYCNDYTGKSCPTYVYDFDKLETKVRNRLGGGGGGDDGTRTIQDGTYKVVNVNSGKVLDVAGVSSDDGADIHQWSYGGGANQEWQAEHLGNGEYRLTATHSGKVADGNASGENNVHQWGWHGGDNQRWYVDDLGGGEYRIREKATDWVLDVADAGTSDGDTVVTWEWHGGANQRWRFEAIDGGGGGGSYDWTVHSRGDSSEAVYTIQYLLEEHGHDLEYHDGIYGSEVEQNVTWFQDARGLTVDGIVGPETWEHLHVYVWDEDDDPWWATYAAQHHLRYDEGYDIAVDGYYGPETEGAIENFQHHAGITVDGIVGSETWKALLNH